MIRQADPARQYESQKAEIDAAVIRVLASGRYIGGPEVEGFEREFARACGVAHAVAVASGTDALRLALLAADVTAQGEVITSPLSFLATTEAISQAGGRPVFADIDPDTFTLDPGEVERALTGRTRAILPVHLYGHPADLDPIREIGARRGLAIIEDACQAHGALYRGKPAGSLGTAAGFSFYPTKNLGGCGEGGIVTTDDEGIAVKVRRLRDHGQVERYRHVEEGYNARLDALQAAVLRVKLTRLDAWNDRRRELAGRYRERLAGSPVVLPVERPWARHVYHQFTVRLPGRDRVREVLRGRDIDAQVHYPLPLHLQPCYASMGLGEGSFPEAERATREILCLPIHSEMAPEQVDRVAEVLLDAVRAG
ncbi:MAG: DegT/DnrJ/EryC1/StrS family aminotransferase [Acidobacteria bacterium]|nr:DegT/DnrJ/EryC1/StrS family aminotransferase [Acidobacteriota bacterium]